MKCPRCEGNVLDERERQGVVVDVCPACRGVWLDRGELEKLLAVAKRELEEERAYYGAPREAYPPARSERDSEPPSSRRGYARSHTSHGDPYSKHGHGPYRKKSWLENLGDIFD